MCWCCLETTSTLKCCGKDVCLTSSRYYHCETSDTLLEETRSKLKHLSNVTVMQKTSVTIGGVLILGTTLWSDVPEEDAGAVSKALNDYLVIRVGTGAEKRRVTVADTNAWHKDERAWLEKEISAARGRNQPVVVLTHHAPLRHGTSAPKFDGNQINVAFSTELSCMLGPPVMAWLYGHTHYNNKQTKKGTLVTCNQVGYIMVPGERVGFDPHLVLDVTATGATLASDPPPAQLKTKPAAKKSDGTTSKPADETPPAASSSSPPP